MYPVCFLVDPIYGAALPVDIRGWDPNHEIIGWIRRDTGEQKKSQHDYGIGAMWRACWLPKNFEWDNETEPHLYVCTPGGDWDMDQRCKNCSSPEDKIHRCWIRHGIPPNITVNKKGVTCNAGAGSIAQKTWHGFLKEGKFMLA
jgi:hypothetical protein